ncbi:MAG: hypothetical protein ACRC8P_01060, partial [Spiroplasma sp.]
NTEIVANKNLSSNDYQLVELEKQKETIFSLAEYQKKLYIGMHQNYLAKMNSDGKVTQIPLEDAGKTQNNIMVMKKFNGAFYLADTTELLEMNSNGEIKKIYEVDENEFIKSLEVFNNELYFIVPSLMGENRLMKMDSKGKVSKVLDFAHNFILSDLKTFNNHLYFVMSDILHGGSQIDAIDIDGEISQITTIEDNRVEHLIEFNNKLYICLDNGSLFTIDANDEIEVVIKRNVAYGPNVLIVFQNELYLGTLYKLEKLTKDNKIETVAELMWGINALATFNNELYIGMNGGYFAKLS